MFWSVTQGEELKFIFFFFRENPDCLLASSVQPRLKDQDSFLIEKLGEKFTPDQQCQFMYGSKSFHCAVSAVLRTIYRIIITFGGATS